MQRIFHRLSDIDEINRTATCSNCGHITIWPRTNVAKEIRWCCRGTKPRNKTRWYAANKKSFCELCGFVALHKGQLDVHHLDGNHRNNLVENLQTLCANCHRLVECAPHLANEFYNGFIKKESG